MAKSADAADLKSADPKGLWEFKSPSGHHKINSLQPISLIPQLQSVPLVNLAVHVNQDKARGLMGFSQLFEDFAPRLTYPMRLSGRPGRSPEAARSLSAITLISTEHRKKSHRLWRGPFTDASCSKPPKCSRLRPVIFPR
jgi:hypothetical protein